MEKSLRTITQKCCLLAAVLWCTLSVQAQVSTYIFSQSSGTYTPITGGTVVGGPTDDDAVYGNLPIGFTFNFNGTPYTTFGINVNGWLMMGSTTPTSSYYGISDGYNDDVVSALSQDMMLGFRATGVRTSGSNQLTGLSSTIGVNVGDVVTGTGIPAGTTVTAIAGNTITMSANATSSSSSATINFANGEMRYETIGTSPNQTLVMQWKNVRKYGEANDLFNWQIRLNENGSVDVVYGTVVNNTTTSTVEVGLYGTGSDYNNRESNTDWSATTAGNSITDYVALTNTVVPASGLTFTWTPAAACTGQPVAGTASSDNPSICAGNDFTLSLTGNTVAPGITYQWISSTDGITYADEANGTASSYTTNITTSTWYRAIATCTGSGLSDTTAPIQVTVNNPALCYCTASLGGACGDADVANLTILGTTLNNSPSCVTTANFDAYQAFPAVGTTTATLVAGSTYTLTLTMDAAGISSVWFDWDQSGTFDASEWTQITTNATNGTISITVPNNASLGLTGMRIRTRLPGNTNGASSACDNFGSGEAQDYLITVVAAGACTNPPVAGNIMGVAPVCPGNTVTLVDTGYTLGTTLQWQTSTDGSTWADVNGATNGAYATPAINDTVFYRVMVICADTSYTSAIEIDLNPFYNCYCTTDLGGYCNSSVITNVYVDNTTINNSNSDCNELQDGGVYTAFPDTGVATGSLYISVPYDFTVTLSEGSITSVWIDWDHSGTFDANEWTQLSVTGTPAVATVTVPLGALPGPTGMRIRSRNEGNNNGATDACSNFGSGETEDYIITLLDAPACVTPTVGGTATGNDTVYMPSAAQYIVSGYTGNTITWQYALDSVGPWSNITGTNNDTVNITFGSPGVYYLRAILTSPGCDADSSNFVATTAILAGDDVCDAVALNLGVNGPYSTEGATTETGEPAPPNTDCSGPMSWCNSTLDGTLWFSFVAPASGRVSLQSPGFDTQLALWDAPSCSDILTGGATLLAAVDDDGDYTLHNGAQYSSYIDSVTCLIPGKTYYIQLDAYSGFGTTTVIITDLGPGPDASFTNLPDHICADAAAINLNPTTAGGTFYGYGITGNTLDPAQAYQQLQGQGSFVVYYQFWACYQSTDTVEIDSLPVATVAGITNANCFGESNGAINITATGNGPFTYSWSDNSTNEDLTGVAAGTYSAMVMDAYNCMATLSNLSVTEPTALTPTPDSVINVSCNGGSNGGIYISVAGGTAPYTYLWSNGSTNQDATGLTAGIYTGTITDNHGCTFASPQVPITEPAAINVTVDSVMNNACNGDQSGRVYITASNGTAPFSYTWSNGSTNEDLSGVVGGTYTVTVADANGCSATPVSGTLTDPAAIVITADATVNVGCNGGSNGSISTTTTGGAGNFTYAWTTSATTDDITGLSAGSYTITATDANNCSSMASFTVTEPTALAAVVDSVHNVACFSESTGDVFATTTGGTTPYSFVWSSGQTTEDLNGVPGGTYTISATDANGCSASASATVTTPAAGVSSHAVVTDEVQGQSTGAIDLTANGGTPPYTYSWSNGATTEDITGLNAGVYSCTISDANGCTKVERDTVKLIIGIDDLSSNMNVSLYPNPAQDQFFIEVNLPAEQDVAIEIYSVSGQLIQTLTDRKVVAAKYAMNMGAEASGIYYAKIKVEGSTAIRRFVISH